MGFLWDTIYYNRGRGASNGNNYWKKYAVPHYILCAVLCLLLGIGIGLASLFVCSAYLDNLGWEMFLSYLNEPLILLLNLVPPVLLVAAFYFAFGRLWAGFLAGGGIITVLSLINYYKIRIRTESFTFSDIAIAGEAAGILNRYKLELTGRVIFIAAALVLGTLAAAFLARGKIRKWWVRLTGAVLAIALLFTLGATVYQQGSVYRAATNRHADYNQWSELANYVSRGFVYPFIHSASGVVSDKPEGYSDAAAKEVLGKYADKDIPSDKKVNIIAVMLEAYTDLSEHPEIGVNDDVYAPLHKIYGESLHGHLSPNIFGGGTIDTERNFLTGYVKSGDYRALTNSHVWYLRSQGYYAEGYHAGDSWFYNRLNVEKNLGMENFYFMEDFDGAVRSDWSFFPILVNLYEGRDKETPYFSFSVTYQNHGSYASDTTYEESHLDRSGKSEAAYNILNNYLHGIKDTSERLLSFIEPLRDDPEPVVFIFFGDHMPWLGDGNFIFNELGISIDLSTEEGFYNYYNTPWVIWANDAAKKALGDDFIGDGGRISSAFLLNEVFSRCGVEGSAWLQYNSDTMQRMDIANTGSNIYRIDGDLYTYDMLEGEALGIVRDHSFAEYYMKHHFAYSGLAR